MENAWNEYLKLEKDVEQLKQTLQEQHRRAFFFQVTKKESCYLPHLHHYPVKAVTLPSSFPKLYLSRELFALSA